jgi:hypothetical protein
MTAFNPEQAVAELSNATVHTFHYSIHTASAFTRMICILDVLLNP